MHDFRLAVRALRATPIVTAAALLSLALGIGANTAIFSLADALLLRSLPVADPHRLVDRLDDAPRWAIASSSATRRSIRSARHAAFFDGALGYTSCCGTSTLTRGGESFPVDRQYVTRRFLRHAGRAGVSRTPVHARRQRAGAEPTARWRSSATASGSSVWAARDDVVGMRLTIDRTPFTIIGVTPPGFFGVEVGRAFDVAIPSRLAARLSRTPFDDDTTSLSVMLRLKPGLSLAAAAAALQAVQPQIRAGAMPRPTRAAEFLRDPVHARSRRLRHVGAAAAVRAAAGS